MTDCAFPLVSAKHAYNKGCRCARCTLNGSTIPKRRQRETARLVATGQRIYGRSSTGFDRDAAIARAADAMFTTVDDHRQHRSRETA